MDKVVIQDGVAALRTTTSEEEIIIVSKSNISAVSWLFPTYIGAKCDFEI